MLISKISKIRKTVSKLKKLSYLLQFKTLIMIYKALIESLGIKMYGYCSSCHYHIINIMQKYVLKLY